MAFEQVVSANDNGSLGTIAAQFTTKNITSGNTIVVAVAYVGSAGATCADNASGGSNSYTSQVTATGLGGAVTIFSAPITNGSGTKPTVTVTLPGTPTFRFLIVAEYSAIGAIDQTAHGDASSASSGTDDGTVGPVTTTTDGQLVLGAIYTIGGSTITAGTNFTERSSTFNVVGFQLEDLTQSTAGSISATWTVGGGSVNDLVMATFKAAAAGGATTYPQLERGRRGIARGVIVGAY